MEDGKEEDTTDFYLFDEKTTTTDHLKNNLFQITNCSLAFLALQELCAQSETSPGVQVKENSNSQYLEFSLLSRAKSLTVCLVPRDSKPTGD